MTLGAGETRTVVFAPEQFPKLRVRIRSCGGRTQMGKPHLEALRMSFRVDGKLSDESVARVGIREVTSELTDKGARLFRLNGEPVLMRGGGWSAGYVAARVAAANCKSSSRWCAT